MFVFGALANEFIVRMMQQTPTIAYNVAQAVPFVGEFFFDARSAQWIQRPFTRVRYRLYYCVGTLLGFRRRVNRIMHSRDNDRPAEVWSTGYVAWHRHGKLHRDCDKPAIMNPAYGTMEWYQRGKRHRDGDKAAVIEARDWLQEWWYRHGVLHRDFDRPACISRDADGDSATWYQNGKVHRDFDQPAIIRYDWREEWWTKGIIRRVESGQRNWKYRVPARWLSKKN